MSHPGPRGISGPCSHPECYNSINDKCPGCGRSWLLVTALDLENIKQDTRKETLADVQKMIMGNAYNFLNKNAEFICKRIQNMML